MPFGKVLHSRKFLLYRALLHSRGDIHLLSRSWLLSD
jgi:hypothetical protein